MLKVCLDDQETCQLLFLGAEDFAPRHSTKRVSMLHVGQSHRPPEEGRRGEGHCHRDHIQKICGDNARQTVQSPGRSGMRPISVCTVHSCRGRLCGSRGQSNHRCRWGSDAPLHGVEAYDYVLRSSMLAKLLGVTGIRPPFEVRLARPCRSTTRSPLLFSLAIDNGLVSVKREMRAGGRNCSSSWTTCTSCRPQPGHGSCTTWLEKDCSPCRRSRFTLGGHGAGIASDSLRPTWSHCAQRWIKVLGTPLGSAEFDQEASNQRLQEERRLWEVIQWIPDLQCAWQVLLQCSGPLCERCLLAVRRLMRKGTTK